MEVHPPKRTLLLWKRRAERLLLKVASRTTLQPLASSALLPQRQHLNHVQRLEMESVAESWLLRLPRLRTTLTRDPSRQLLKSSLQLRDWREVGAALRGCMAARLPCWVLVAPIGCLQAP